MGIEVKGLAAARRLMDGLRAATRVPQVFIDMPNSEEAKVGFIVRGDASRNRPARDILQLTPKLMTAMAAAFTRGMAKALKGDADAPWRMAAEEYLRFLQNRIQFSGGDVSGKMAPLAESTRKRKGHGRLFYDSGDLAKAIAKARIRIVRK